MYAQIGPLAVEQHRVMLAEARRQRPAQRLLAIRRASRRADRAERRMQRAHRTVSRLRAEPEL